MEDNEDTIEKTTSPEEPEEEKLFQQEYPEYKRLRKSNYNKIILGVCGGMSEYFSIAPLFFRLLFLFSIVIGGWGIIAYLITALIMPGSNEVKEPDEAELEKIKSSNNVSVVAGIILLTGLYILLENFGYFEFLSALGIPSRYITVLLLSVIMFFLFSLKPGRKSEAPPKERYSRRMENALFGGVCSGLAEYLDISVSSLRLFAVLFTFLTMGVPIFVYLFFLAVIPKGEKA